MKAFPKWVLCFALVFVPGCSLMPESGGLPFHQPPELNFVEVEGFQFPYRLVVPPAYNANDKTQAWPLVIGLHGAGGDENAYLTHRSGRDSIDVIARKRGYVVAMPAAPRARKDLSTSVVVEVVKEVQKHGRINPDRIYVTGFSMGGFTTYRVIHENPDLFAAAFPIVCPPFEDVLEGLEKTPLFIFLGTRDKHFDQEHTDKMIQAIKDAGGEVHLHLHEGGHGGYRLDWTYEMIFDWFDQHTKADKKTPDPPKDRHVN